MKLLIAHIEKMTIPVISESKSLSILYLLRFMLWCRFHQFCAFVACLGLKKFNSNDQFFSGHSSAIDCSKHNCESEKHWDDFQTEHFLKISKFSEKKRNPVKLRKKKHANWWITVKIIALNTFKPCKRCLLFHER